jgi:arginine decarboxylase-like protein
MTQAESEIKLTRQQLETMNRLHRLELRQIRHMSEAQFQIFRRNFSFGQLENITRAEAQQLLMSMLALNLQLLGDLKDQG